jgi:hypothetical protein
MSAIGLPRDRDFVISRCADSRFHHLMFARQQPVEMRALEWEGRIRPLASWSVLAMRAGGAAALALAKMAMLVS